MSALLQRMLNHFRRQFSAEIFRLAFAADKEKSHVAGSRLERAVSEANGGLSTPTPCHLSRLPGCASSDLCAPFYHHFKRKQTSSERAAALQTMDRVQNNTLPISSGSLDQSSFSGLESPSLYAHVRHPDQRMSDEQSAQRTAARERKRRIHAMIWSTRARRGVFALPMASSSFWGCQSDIQRTQ